MQAAGVSHPSEITAHHIVRRSSDNRVRSLAQSILTQLPTGALLDDNAAGLPLIYRQNWPLAQAESFQAKMSA